MWFWLFANWIIIQILCFRLRLWSWTVYSHFLFSASHVGGKILCRRTKGEWEERGRLPRADASSTRPSWSWRWPPSRSQSTFRTPYSGAPSSSRPSSAWTRTSPCCLFRLLEPLSRWPPLCTFGTYMSTRSVLQASWTSSFESWVAGFTREICSHQKLQLQLHPYQLISKYTVFACFLIWLFQKKHQKIHLSI